jgi:hypothetical protein
LKIHGLDFSNVELEILPSKKVVNNVNNRIESTKYDSDETASIFDDYYNSATFMNDVECLIQDLGLS